jgi:hypothetical protein
MDVPMRPELRGGARAVRHLARAREVPGQLRDMSFSAP